MEQEVYKLIPPAVLLGMFQIKASVSTATNCHRYSTKYHQSAELQIGYCMTAIRTGQIVSQCPYVQQRFNASELNSIYQVLPLDELDEVNETLCSVKDSCAVSVRMDMVSLCTDTMDEYV